MKMRKEITGSTQLLPPDAKPLAAFGGGRYYATPDGGIWSVHMGWALPCGKRVYQPSPAARMCQTVRRLKPSNGGQQVRLQLDNGGSKTCSVARLILETFDRSPEPGEVAYHINGYRDDNRLENLKWTTRRDILTGTADTEED